MPARDIYHVCVKNALVRDGWTITDDPLVLEWGDRSLFVDLGAERMLAAEKAGQKIAVEIKSFLGPSEVADLEQAIGQYTVYNTILRKTEPDRKLYLAVTKDVYVEVFDDDLGELMIQSNHLSVIVFDPHAEEILKWIG